MSSVLQAVAHAMTPRRGMSTPSADHSHADEPRFVLVSERPDRLVGARDVAHRQHRQMAGDLAEQSVDRERVWLAVADDEPGGVRDAIAEPHQVLVGVGEQRGEVRLRRVEARAQPAVRW
jgi:hypothetical protein